MLSFLSFFFFPFSTPTNMAIDSLADVECDLEFEILVGVSLGLY